MHRRIGVAHLFERRLRWDTAVHDPDSARLAVLAFDAREKIPQRGTVGRVARQHFVGQRQAFGRHHQRDDHLHAIASVITRVTVLALVLVIERRIGFEVRARQVVKQYVKFDVE
jgi:hypothetical protein